MKVKRFSAFARTVLFAFAAFSVFSAGCAFSGSKKVLFIGDQFLQGYDIPVIFQRIAESKGKKVEIGSSLHATYRIAYHLKSSETMQKIGAKKWDMVIANENFQAMLDKENFDSALYPSYAEFTKLLKSRNLPFRFVIDPAIRDGYVMPDLDTYAEMQNALTGNSETLAKKYGFSLIPVGVAWEKAFNTHPELRLWQAPTNKSILPGVDGAYLVACVIYSSVFGESPEGSSYRSLGVTEENAKIMQKVAYDAVIAYRNQK